MKLLSPFTSYLAVKFITRPESKTTTTTTTTSLSPFPATPSITQAALLGQRAASPASIDVRYPPPTVRKAPHGYHHHNFAAWTSPPMSHLIGIYHITHTSHDVWKNRTNLQVKRYPVDSSDEGCAAYANDTECPGGSLGSVLTWCTCATASELDGKDGPTVSEFSSYDIPIGALGPTDRKYTAAWRYSATERASADHGRLYAVMAWGVDVVGAEWLVEYDTEDDERRSWKGEGSVSFLSRSDGGPADETFAALIREMRDLFAELEDTDLVEMVERVQRTKVHGRRGCNEHGFSYKM